jgi:DNA polymerase-3 subunit epsilon
VELVHHSPTGKYLHLYLNPERDIDVEAIAVHGLTREFLSDKPLFNGVVDEFLSFIDNDPLVIHNASFDVGFINAELERLQRPILSMERSIDTLLLARKKFPGAQAKLDSLCRRFGINNEHRTFHGALLDAYLLADVYIELLGGKQPGLSLGTHASSEPVSLPTQEIQAEGSIEIEIQNSPIRLVRPHAPKAAEKTAHDDFINKLNNPIWFKD